MKKILKNNINSNKKKKILLFSVISLIILLGISWIVSAAYYTPQLFPTEAWTGIDQAHHNPIYTERIIAIGTGTKGDATSDNVIIDAANVGFGTATPNSILSVTFPGAKILNIKEGTNRAILSIEGETWADISLVDAGGTNNQKWMVIRNDAGKTSFIPHKDDGSPVLTPNAALSIEHSTGNVVIGSNLDVTDDLTTDTLTVDSSLATGTLTVGGQPFINGRWSDIAGGIDYSEGNVYIGSDSYTLIEGATNGDWSSGFNPECSECDDDWTFDCDSRSKDRIHDTIADNICYDYGSITGDSSGVRQVKTYQQGAHLLLPGLEGKVGIGTDNPTENLHVVGNVKVVGDMDLVGFMDVDGDIEADSFLYSSDISLKNNIQPIQNSLEKIDQLQGVEFTWKKTGQQGIGLIAQNVEEVFPELVATDSDGLKSLSYGNLVAPLIEAIKEQQRQIEELKAEIEDLRNQ